MPPSPTRLTRWAPFMLVASMLPTLPTTSIAQAYKCMVDGKVTYQQAKCNGGAPVNTSGAGNGDPLASASVRLQQEVAVYKRRDAVEEAISQQRVIPGMTSEEALKSWGRPTKINRTVTAGGSREQWVYRNEEIGNDRYVYVENGTVRTIQTSKKTRDE